MEGFGKRWIMFLFLVVSCVMGTCGGMFGLVIAHVWLDQASIREAFRYVMHSGLWIASIGGGIGAAASAWIVWHMYVVRNNLDSNIKQ